MECRRWSSLISPAGVDRVWFYIACDRPVRNYGHIVSVDRPGGEHSVLLARKYHQFRRDEWVVCGMVLYHSNAGPSGAGSGESGERHNRCGSQYCGVLERIGGGVDVWIAGVYEPVVFTDND